MLNRASGHVRSAALFLILLFVMAGCSGNPTAAEIRGTYTLYRFNDHPIPVLLEDNYRGQGIRHEIISGSLVLNMDGTFVRSFTHQYTTTEFARSQQTDTYRGRFLVSASTVHFLWWDELGGQYQTDGVIRDGRVEHSIGNERYVFRK